MQGNLTQFPKSGEVEAEWADLRHMFVYGTLKRGGCRERCWPVPPTSVQPAWTLGELIDTGPYPALLAGGELVGGEVWSFRGTEIAQVLKTLDVIEGTGQPGQENEYDRAMSVAYLLSGQAVHVELYRYAAPERLAGCVRVTPWLQWHGRSFAVWPVGANWPNTPQVAD